LVHRFFIKVKYVRINQQVVNKHIDKRNYYFFILVFLLTILNAVISVLYIQIHGVFLVSDGYYNYAVYFKNTLFSHFELFTLNDSLNFGSFPYNTRILYPFLLALFSHILNINIITASYIVNSISIIVLLALIWIFIQKNEKNNDRKVICFIFLLSTPIYIILSLKLSVDLILTTLMFGSVTNIIYFIKSEKKKYIVFSVLCALFAIITKEIGLIIFCFYFFLIINKYLKSYWKSLLITISGMLLAFIVMLILAGSTMSQYYYWVSFFVYTFKPYNPPPVKTFFQGFYYLFIWLFSFKSLGKTIFSIGMTFGPFMIISVSYMFLYKIKRKLSFKELFKTISNKFKVTYGKIDFYMFIFSLLYFLSIYFLQASYFNERYLLPICFLVYFLIFKLFAKENTFLSMKSKTIFILTIVGNYFIVLLRLLLIFLI